MIDAIDYPTLLNADWYCGLACWRVQQRDHHSSQAINEQPERQRTNSEFRPKVVHVVLVRAQFECASVGRVTGLRYTDTTSVCTGSQTRRTPLSHRFVARVCFERCFTQPLSRAVCFELHHHAFGRSPDAFERICVELPVRWLGKFHCAASFDCDVSVGTTLLMPDRRV